MLKKHYNQKLSKKIIKLSYAYANNFVKKLNAKRVEKLSATAALVIVKDGTLFASRLCDSGFALFRERKILFRTPEFWSDAKRKKRKGYGVINGKASSLKYIDTYIIKYKPGDILVLYTDGFENHFGEKGFTSFFQNKNLNRIEINIKQVDAKLIAKDPEKFDKERTILIVQLM